MTKRKVGFFGGSFDPIHLGHINLLVRLKEIEGLDFIWLCPATCSVFKRKSPPIASGEARQKMIEIAIKEFEGVGCLDYELKQNRACYTIDTMRILQEQEEADYYLLLGEDTLSHFHLWKEAENLCRISTPLVGSRGVKNKFDFDSHTVIGQSLSKGMRNIPSMEVSSTEVRQRLGKKYCGHLVQKEVLDFIDTNGLYYSSLNNS